MDFKGAVARFMTILYFQFFTDNSHQAVMEKDWTPDVQSSTENGNIHTSFSPWDERAEFIRVVLNRERENYVQDEVYLPRMKTSAIFTDVPCDVVYRIKLRSYDAHNFTLMKFYWGANETIEIPCEEDVTTVPPQSYTELDLLAITGVSMVTALLLLTVIFCLWHKRARIKSNCGSYCIHGRSKQERSMLNNCDNYIFPIYYIENSAHGEAIHAHIRLLKTRGINIHTYDEQRRFIQEDFPSWVESSLDRCSVVLVYHSQTIDRLILEDILPDEPYLYGGVCQYSLRQLTTKIGTSKTTVHVSFDLFRDASTTDVTSLVTKDELGIRLVNLDLVLKRLSRLSHSLLTEKETSELQSVCTLYGLSSLNEKDFNDSTLTLSETDSLLDGGEETVDGSYFQGRAV